MKNPHTRIGLWIALCAVLLGSALAPVIAQTPVRDGVHDFDWDVGTWSVHQKRLLHPLTGSTSWAEYDGTDAVQRIWDGANTGRIHSEGSAGRLDIYTLRVYNADEHAWSIYFLNSAAGILSQPVTGEFKDGRGEFYDQEPYGGKMIFVRFRAYDVTKTSCRFDQSFSADGGKTWEVNFIVDETLSKR